MNSELRMTGMAAAGLASQVMHAFKSVPKRGLEIGGILLGRVLSGDPRVVVENFEPVDSQHLHGPSWLLSEPDRLALRTTLDRLSASPQGDLQPVGFFRSNTRPDFTFDDQDREMFQAATAISDPVFLLIKPSHSEPPLMQIAIRIGETLTPVETVPLNIAALQEAGMLAETVLMEPVREPVNEQVSEPPVAAARPTTFTPPITELPTPRPRDVSPVTFVPLPSEQPPVGVERPWYKNPRWLLAIVAPLALAAVALPLLRNLEQPQAGRAAAPTAVVPSAPDTHHASAIPMTVTRKDGVALLSWDGGSSAVRQAQYGILQVTGRGTQQQMQLGAQELEAGSMVLVPPNGEDAAYKLEAVRPATPPAVLPPQPEPASPGSENVRPQAPPQATLPAPPPQFRGPKVDVERENGVDSSVWADAIRPSRVGVLLKNAIPLRWKGFRSGTSEVAARPVVQIKPYVSADLASRMRRQEAVDVRVQIRPNGRVSRADLLAPRAESLLSNPAKTAARQWIFEPARVGNRAVDSSAILHFRFRKSR